MKPLLPLAFAALILLRSVAYADGAAAVHVETPRRGSVPITVAAYGQVAAASQSVRSLTLAQNGQVAAVFVTAGQAVTRGQPLLRFVAAPAAIASYAQAESALKLAQAQQVHTHQLLAGQLATQDQMAVADKAVSDAKASLTALSRDGAGKASTVMTAPADGLAMAVPVTVGDRPAAGATLVSFAPASALQVSVGVEAGWRGHIHAGQAVSLEPLGGGPAVAGKVVRVDAVLNPKTRLVDVDIAAASGAVISGEAFRAEIAVGSKQGWLAPHGAVQVQDGRAFVFQVNGGKAKRVPVTIAQPGHDLDVVEGPIAPRSPLVTVGGYQLDDGGAVRIEN